MYIYILIAISIYIYLSIYLSILCFYPPNQVKSYIILRKRDGVGRGGSEVMLYVLNPLSSIIASLVKHPYLHSPASLDTEFVSCGWSHIYILP